MAPEAFTSESARIRQLFSGYARQLSLWLGALGMILVVGMAISADWIGLADPIEIVAADRLQPPSAGHVAGTDEYGRDVFSRTVYAARISLGVGVIAVAIGLLFGAVIGAAAAFWPRHLDAVLMRTMDILFAFPAILLAIVIMSGLGTSMLNAMLAIGIVFIPGFARLSRALTQSVLNERFIDYARSIQTPPQRILLHEVLPNIWPLLMIQSAIAMAYAVTIEASLSFLGLGAQPPTPSWGNMLSSGRGFLGQAPWMVLAPSVALFVTIISLNLLADGLRETMDPSRGNSR